MNLIKRNTPYLICLALSTLLLGCPTDQDKKFEPITKDEALVQQKLKENLDSNAIEIELKKTKVDLDIAIKKNKFQETIIEKQHKEIQKNDRTIKAHQLNHTNQVAKINTSEKLNTSLENNLKDKSKLIKEQQEKYNQLKSKLQLFHQNSEKLDSNDLKEKNKYIKALLIESQELKKENSQKNIEIKSLNEKIIELEKNPPREIPN